MLFLCAIIPERQIERLVSPIIIKEYNTVTFNSTLKSQYKVLKRKQNLYNMPHSYVLKSHWPHSKSALLRFQFLRHFLRWATPMNPSNTLHAIENSPNGLLQGLFPALNLWLTFTLYYAGTFRIQLLHWEFHTGFVAIRIYSSVMLARADAKYRNILSLALNTFLLCYLYYSPK